MVTVNHGLTFIVLCLVCVHVMARVGSREKTVLFAYLIFG